MILRHRILGIIFIVMVLCMLLSYLFAQSPKDSGVIALSAGDVCQIVGGTVARGFGVWHFFVPSLYGRWSYVPDAPENLQMFESSLGHTFQRYSLIYWTFAAESSIMDL